MEDIRIGGLTADEWEGLSNPEQPTEEDLTGLGIIEQPQQQQQTEPQEDNKPQVAEREDYEDLGYWQTVGDGLLGAGVEATKFFLPKDKELNYTPRTRAGEAITTTWKWLFGIGGLLAGGEVAGVVKGAMAAKNLTAGAKVAGGLEAILKGNKFFKTSKTGAKALGVKGLNILTQGTIQSAILDATIHDADEGRFADILGDTDNKFINWLQTDPNDSTAEAKLKNVIDGAIFTMGINGAVEAASPLIGGVFKGIKSLRNANPEQAAEIVEDIADKQTKLAKVADTSELVEQVKAVRKQAQETGQEASQMIIDNFNPQDIEQAHRVLGILDEGEDIFVHSDGTFDVRVSTWEDAHKVSKQEYKKQLDALDVANGAEYAGDTALFQQDEAIKSTWTNRGWIGAEEELTQSNANKIVKNYKDKFQIDNNIKVEFVDGLTLNGKAVDGNTNATKFLGKVSKTKQNAIDKKALQVQKLKDKVTMLEGGNEPVSDALDVAKEELRIAENELKELQDTVKGKNLKPNITIQIDKNAQNPYATLRAEIEHARDIAKGEVPNQAERHFSRYEGLNEGEAAVDYTYKKSVGRNEALQNVMNNGQASENGLKYNQGDLINGQQTNSNIQSWKGNRTEASNDGLYGTRPSESNEGIRPYIRRSESGSSNTGSIIHDPSPEFKAELEAQGKPINSYKELAANSDEGAASFISNFKAANEFNGKKAAQVYEYSAEEYKQMRCFTAENGKSGFALKADGDIVSVFSTETGSLAGMMNLAIQNGGKKLDCFDTFLPKIYKKFGFEEVNRVKWNEEYKPKNWDKDFFKQFNNGEPDVVYMELKTETPPIKPEEPTQLKIDFDNHINQAQSVEDLANGSVVADTVEDIGKTLNKTIELSPEISGTTWEAIAKDSEKYADMLIKAEELGLDDELKQAISMNDVEAMDAITRKVMASQKLLSHLTDKLAQLGANPPFEQMANIIDSIDMIKRYTKETGSASGRNLEARKLINKTAQVFGSLRLSEATKAGIESLVDVIGVDIKNICDLNFTRGAKLTPEEMKAELMGKWLQNADNPFVQMIINDKEVATAFDEILTKAIQKGGNINLDREIKRALTKIDYENVYKATQLTDNPVNKGKVITNWLDKQGGFTSYYIHNLLSGVGTLAKNVISGAINSAYFPAKKIIAGYLGGGEALRQEGWNTYKAMSAQWKESWDMCKSAFLNGEGKLSVMKDTMAMGEDEVFTGFREWKFDFSTREGIWYAIQNFHSLMTRAMGASDEMMSQFNYRSIKRAKSIEQAKQIADKFGIKDEAVISQLEDNIFKKAFDEAGRPMDVEALAEAKEILYQTPLNGQMFDRATGDMTQVRPESWVTSFAGSLNSAAATNPVLKIMFPFVKTGANILQMNLEHNGVYALLSKNQRELLLSQTREGALARSQVAFGMFSMMSGCMLAMSGHITGSAPTDPNERKALFATGWKPYSIRIGNKYISYQGYEPIETILGFAADSVNIYGNIKNSEDEDKWQKFSQKVMSSLMNNFLDKAAFRTGLRQMAYLSSPDENGADYAKAMQQTTQGFLPDSSFVRNVSSIGKRDVTQPQGYDRILSNYFNRGLGDYRRDVFGNRQDNYGLLVTNAGDDNTYMPEYEELERLAHYGFNPSEITKTITGTKLNYKDFKNPQTGRSVYDTMQEELSTMEINGKTLQEAVRDLVTSQEYDDLPLGVDMNGYKFSRSDETKLNAIRDIFVEYNDKALQNVIEEYGEEYVDKKKRTMSEAVEEVNLKKLESSINQGLDSNLYNQISSF